MNTTPRAPPVYGPVAKLFHWIMFLIITGLFPLGYIMANMEFSPQKLQLYSWHKSFGTVVFFLAVLRLAWRYYRPPPPPRTSTPRGERLAAGAVHALLYLCLFALPASGWLMSSASGFSVVVFRTWQLPNLVSTDEPLRIALFNTHLGIGIFLLTLFVVHVAAAMYHHLVRHDDILARILPFKTHRRTNK
ncbi:MAG: cytochrome b [Rhodobacterales bacterium]